MEREWTVKLNLITGDLFAVGCDAWVNPADTKLSGSGGLDKIFHQKCGPALSRELAGKQLNPLEVLVTSGCGLPVRYILHAAVPRQSQETGAVYEQLETCCRNIVVQASRQRGLRHLAMPLIGTGYAGYSLYSPFYPGLLCGMAAVAILAGIIRGMHQVGGIAEGTSLREITVVCSSEANRVYMQKVWRVMVGQGLDIRSRVRGCLLGGALGDALGYPLEFLNPYEFPESIQMAWKKAEDIRILDKETGKAVISDDTQMTLFTACGLLFGESCGRMRGISSAPWDYIHMAYKDWLRTQDSTYRPARDPVSWISRIPQLNVRRAPGNTCLSALRAGGGSIEQPVNNSKGSGGVMRIAPIPLFLAARRAPQQFVVKACAEAAAITHGHPLGWLSAAALGNLLYDIMLNFSLTYAVRDTMLVLKREFGRYPETDLLIQGMENACCQGRGVDLCLLNAVKHKGDSDTVGSVAGQIWGAYFGVQSFSYNRKLLEALELKDVILEIADDLVNGCKMSESSPYTDSAWQEKYLYCSSSGHQPGTGTHWYGIFPSSPADAMEALYPKVVRNADGTQAVRYVPYQIQLRPEGQNEYGFYHVSVDPEAAEADKPGFGFVETVRFHAGPHSYSYKHGWLRCHDDGSAEGYYGNTPFLLLPNRADHALEVFFRISPEPWMGTIRRRLNDWGAPLEIELRQKPENTLPEALALAAVGRYLRDGYWE